MVAKSRNVVARDRELKIFHQVEQSRKSECLAVYGRRRIGKTYLIDETFNNHPFYFSFTGTKNSPHKKQIKKFMRKLVRLARKMKVTIPKRASDWDEALDILFQVVERAKTDPTQKKIIFFDELPWLCSHKSGFLEALDYFWNDNLSKRRDSILIVCGSAAAWMIKQILNEKGGFHNRVTKSPIAMRPFTMKETKEYLHFRQITSLSDKQIVEIYMVTGGVAHYLDQLNPGESATQFINNNFFGTHGELRKEFSRLFKSLFDEYRKHVAVIRALADHPSGYTHHELLTALQLPSGGTFSEVLEELQESHFIQFNPKLGNKKKEGVYRLIDEYTLFYLKWVEPLGKNHRDNTYWNSQFGKRGYFTWLGHAFENVCFKHSEQIKADLGISGITANVFGYRGKTQMDMLIDRKDDTINLCEMKYTGSVFKLTAKEAKNIQDRKDELLSLVKTGTSVIVTLVTPLPVSNTVAHYTGLIDGQVNLDAFFKI
jgi:AAA+ ATPase superfamily predicted ATPase